MYHHDTTHDTPTPQPATQVLLTALIIWGCILMHASSHATADTTDQPAANAQATYTAETGRLVDEPGRIVARLENGLTVIAHENHNADLVTVRMYVRTGSIYEQEFLGTGISHLFEHLLMGGTTKNRTEAQIEHELDTLGGISNAYTWKDITAYYITTQGKNMSQALDLLGDFVTNPAFPENEFEREWGVVQRELEQYKTDPDRQLHYMTFENLYLEHPARFPVIGHQQALQHLTRQDVIDYYNRMYVPDNTVVVMVGHFDAEDALQVAQDKFRDFKRRPVVNITLPDEPTQTTPRTRLKYMNVPACMGSIAWPTVRLTSDDLYALDVLAYILGHGQQSRLFQRLVLEEQSALSVSCASFTPDWEPGIFEVRLRARPDTYEQAQQSIAEEIDKIRTHPVSNEELHRVKRQKIADHEMSHQQIDDIAEDLAWSYMGTGNAYFSRSYVDNIQKVTAEDVQQVARTYLVDQRICTTAVLPEAMKPQREEETSQTAAANVEMITLDNGLRVVLGPRDTGNIVSVHMFFLGGLLSEDASTAGTSNAMAEMLLRGTTSRTADDISEFFESRGASISASAGRNTFYLRSDMLRDDLPEALNVIADVALHPVFPEHEWSKILPMLLYSIERWDDNWSSELSAYFHQRFYQESPYRFRPSGRHDVVSNLTVEDLQQHYNKYAHAGNAVLTIFGNFDYAQTLATVKHAFADMPAGQAQGPLHLEDEPAHCGTQVYVKHSKHEGTAGLRIGYGGLRLTNTHDRYSMLLLDAVTSGYYYPGGWLHNALRGLGGQDLVYVVHGFSFAQLGPGYFGIYAGCQPEKVNDVYRIIMENMDKARRGEITQAEMDLAKEMIIASELIEEQTAASQGFRAGLDELYGLGYDWQNKHVEMIRNVTRDDVVDAANKFLHDPVVAITTPEPDIVDLGVDIQARDPVDLPYGEVPTEPGQ